MNKTKSSLEQIYIAKHLLRWTLLIFPAAVSAGIIVALFLWLLDIATITRWRNMWLLCLLPITGVIISWMYRYPGKNSAAGNNLIMDEIPKSGSGAPAQIKPMILFTIVFTHLVDGFASREETAVQMGGSVSALFSRWFKLHHQRKRYCFCVVCRQVWGLYSLPRLQVLAWP